jgi:hypothetical protein
VVAIVRQGTPYRRLATNGGEKCGLETRRNTEPVFTLLGGIEIFDGSSEKGVHSSFFGLSE